MQNNSVKINQNCLDLATDLGQILVLNFEQELSAVNDRLRFARLGCTIEQVGERLALRATMPPKPGSTRRAYQQRIYLGLKANSRGLKAAENQAKRLGGELSDKSFDWRNWGWESEVETLTIGEWVERFEANWWKRRRKTFKAESTLESSYLRHFRRLPQDVVLDQFVLVSTIEGITPENPDSRTRRALVLAYSKLCDFAGMPVDLSEWKGRYSPVRLEPRDLPSDAEIEAVAESILDPWWAWAYRMMATYGLRNHELFHCEFDGSKLRIGAGAKTGYRVVRPMYPEWFARWDLANMPPHKFGLERVRESSNSRYGMWINRGFKRRGIEKPYNLRHCYARRCREALLPATLAAKMMGHSVKVHEETYQRWITEGDDDRLFEALVAKLGRS